MGTMYIYIYIYIDIYNINIYIHYMTEHHWVHCVFLQLLQLSPHDTSLRRNPIILVGRALRCCCHVALVVDVVVAVVAVAVVEPPEPPAIIIAYATSTIATSTCTAYRQSIAYATSTIAFIPYSPQGADQSQQHFLYGFVQHFTAHLAC